MHTKIASCGSDLLRGPVCEKQPALLQALISERKKENGSHWSCSARHCCSGQVVDTYRQCIKPRWLSTTLCRLIMLMVPGMLQV